MRRGFALIEVVIAGVILAVGLAGIINVSMRAMDMQRRGEAEVVSKSASDRPRGRAALMLSCCSEKSLMRPAASGLAPLKEFATVPSTIGAR
jgi:prepilin-type N-terminal cleavage/methylation domain-containing protein